MISLTSPFKSTLRSKKIAISSVADVITERLPLYQGRTVIRVDNGTSYDNIASDEYLGNIYLMISYFYDAQPADTQAVIATFVKNRPEWDMTAFASLYTGNVLFPLDTKMNDDELHRLLTINPPDFLLISQPQVKRMRALLKELNLHPTLLICDLYQVFEDQEGESITDLEPKEVRLSQITTLYEGRLEEDPSPRLDDEDTVLCNYATSGTTSLPKVVELTHKNIIFQVNEAMDILNIRLNEDFLNLGPYTHIATLLEFLVAKSKSFTVSYFTREADEDDVLEDEIKKLKKQGVRIRCLMAVPKFWIYIMKEVLEEMKNKPILHNLYRHLIGIEKSNNFYDIGALDKAKLISVRTFLKNKLGGNFAYGISSSTKLDPAIIEIFSKLGITIIDIYGATEACGVIAKNSLNESKRGSCGRLIPGLEAKLENMEELPGISYPVGELYIKGDALAKGYKGADRLLIEEDQFYNTGDVAYMDEENWVYIIGRKKELIPWHDGSYVDLMRMSNQLVRSVWIKDAMAIRLNETDPYLSVFVFPDYKRIRKDANYKERIKNGLTEQEVLRTMFEEAIAYAQSLIGEHPELSTEKIYILEKKLERTPTHKIKFISELKRLNLESYV
uniref:AMP-binding protein n=1 Tax=Roseihalotalea indica TaxID=2867963 RepID=A0AA49GJS0_9BACT|nr:AMP-binding protein [Tunicatimonas sp. TK19036]